MKAIRLQFRGGIEALVFEEAPLPRLGEGAGGSSARA